MFSKLGKKISQLVKGKEKVYLDDRDIWSRPLEEHSFGEFSFAVAKGNFVIEDHSQVETTSGGIFVGIYDGHGGSEASRYVESNLFEHFVRQLMERGNISSSVIRNAIAQTEEGFLAEVEKVHRTRPSITGMGTCCLVGVIMNKKIYVANVGDSRVVLGRANASKKIIADQLSLDHNVNKREVREEVRAMNRDDPNAVVKQGGVWRIQGIIQVSRAIGDAYLKKNEYNLPPNDRNHRRQPLLRPAITAEPMIQSRVVRPTDRFLIFASDGLWEYLTNQEAVDIVRKRPRQGIARTLVKKALKKAAKRVGMKYDEVIKLSGSRRQIHDDITVAVVFIDYGLLSNLNPAPEMSVRGFIDVVTPSKFGELRGETHTAGNPKEPGESSTAPGESSTTRGESSTAPKESSTTRGESRTATRE